jgi:D-arabinose 1-dehydrogenase-like Zn-dependent alcohol dehydrogenase
MVPGDEIIGHVVGLGPNCSTRFKLGQIVGVGAVSLSCDECDA